MHVVVHYWMSSAKRWCCVKENCVALYKEEDDPFPLDFILLNDSCSITEVPGTIHKFKVTANSYLHSKSWTISTGSTELTKGLYEQVKTTINATKVPTMDAIEDVTYPDEKVPYTIRICSYNVNFGCCDVNYLDKTEESIYNALIEADGDIVLFQETTADWESYFLSKQTISDKYPYYEFYDHYFGMNGPIAGGIAFMSKYPIVCSQIIPSPTEWFPGLLVILQTPLGDVQFLNVHLRPPLTRSALPLPQAYFSSKGDRIKEIQWYSSFLKPNLPIVVCGDFNENESAGSTSFLTKHICMTNAMVQFKCPVTWWWRLPGGFRPTAHFDHIIYKGVRCLHAGVISKGESDHYPVYADLTFLHLNPDEESHWKEE